MKKLGAQVDSQGNVTLYHATSKENKVKIYPSLREAEMQTNIKENESNMETVISFSRGHENGIMGVLKKGGCD